MGNKPYSHFLSLPRRLSQSGQKPALKARVWFVFLGVTIAFVFSNLLVSALTVGVMFPGVSVAGKDLSFKTQEQARKILSDMRRQRNFTVEVGDQTFLATSSDLGAQYELDETLKLAYAVGHTSPLPIMGFFDANKLGQMGYSYSINRDELKKFTSKVISAVGIDPLNATLAVVDGQLTVVADKDGFRVDQKLLDSIIRSSIADGKDKNLKLSPVSVKAPFLAADTAKAKQQADAILLRTVVLNYDGRQFIPDRATIGRWLEFRHTINSDGTIALGVYISREQILGYLQSVANQVNVAPKNKKVNIRNGVSSVEQEGQNGSAILQAVAADAIMAAIESKSVSINLQTQPIAFKTETNSSVSLEYGRYIEVNLSRQQLWAYQDNQVIFSTPITSGATGAGFPTVTGLFSIYAKETARYLNGRPYGWDYNVYVDYWMPFYGGYGLHDADWRSAFGGQDYYYGGSHGCVNMPKASAAFLYGWASIGTPVWVHN